MTELTVTTPAGRTPVPMQPAAGVDLATAAPGLATNLATLTAWAQAMQQATQLVAPLVWTDLVPLHHWPMPPGQTLKSFPNPRLRHPQESEESHRHRCEIAVASAGGIALRSISMGLNPLVGLEQMFNIRGKLGMHTKAKLAIAKAQGIKAWDEELTADAVTVAGVDPITGKTETIRVTMAEAKTAGWTDNDAYRKTPKDMLWSRAMGRLLDRIAGHILMGLASTDDAADAADADERRTDEAVAAVTVQDIKARAASAVPDAAIRRDPVEVVDTRPDPAGPIDKRTWDRINSTFVSLGITGPGQTDRRMRAIGRIVGRTVAKGSDLTGTEGALVLDTLTAQDRDSVLALTEQPPVTPQQAPAVEAEAAPQHDEGLPPLPGDDTPADDVDPTTGDDPWAQQWGDQG